MKISDLPVVPTPDVPTGTYLLINPAAMRLYDYEGATRIRPVMGWKAEVRQIVRDGMADVLAWLGDNAPPLLPDEDEETRRRVRYEARIMFEVRRPEAFVRGTFL